VKIQWTSRVRSQSTKETRCRNFRHIRWSKSCRSTESAVADMLLFVIVRLNITYNMLLR
jgi:hypothetical protein